MNVGIGSNFPATIIYNHLCSDDKNYTCPAQTVVFSGDTLIEMPLQKCVYLSATYQCMFCGGHWETLPFPITK